MEYAGKVLMLLQNNPFPSDVRVWQEAGFLNSKNWKVLVICPGKKRQKNYEVVDGVSIYRYPMLSVVKSFLGYTWEYFYSICCSFLLSLKLLFTEGFDVIHAHNPPDILFIIGLFYKLLGKKFVFDHHDLSPELYLSRFNTRKKILYRMLLVFEKMSCKTADCIIATNQSYKEVEIGRDRVDPGKIYIVRNGPDLNRVKLVAPDEKLKSMGKKILGYVGEMNPQDGMDNLLRSIEYLVYNLKRTDFYTVIIGRGDALPDLKKLSSKLQITDYVWFTGWIPDKDMIRYLSTADICVDPDPSNPLNDKSTWIKIMEYMALGKPIVSFDLPETRFSAREAAIYAKRNDEQDFARKIIGLMDNSDLRKRMGAYGRERIERELAWHHVSKNLLTAYKSLKRTM